MLPALKLQRRGLIAELIPAPARKIAPMGRRSVQATWKGYFFAYSVRTSRERSSTGAPAVPKRREILNSLVTPGFISWQVITKGYLAPARKFVEYGTLTE